MQAQSGKHRSGIVTSGGGRPWREAAQQLQLIRLLPLFSPLVLLSWQVPASAAEFGEASISSFIGQPLVAEVEVIALSPDEQGGLLVRPAQLDVYRGASIKFNPALSGLHWVVQRRGQRQFIRLNTDRPVSTPFLNLFLELGVKGEMSVRALTLWLEAAPDDTGSAQPEVLASAETRPSAGSVPDFMGPDPGVQSLPASQSVRLCKGTDQCAAVDRENRRIARQITELEKNVGALRRVIVGAASTPGNRKAEVVPRQASVPAAPEASVEAVADVASAETELFLKKEEPVLPKPPVLKTTPWKLIAMIAAAVVALLLAAGLLYKRFRKNKKNASKNKVEKKLSWWSGLREKWHKRKGSKPPVTDAGQAADGGSEAPPVAAENDVQPVAEGKDRGKTMLAAWQRRWQGMKTGMLRIFGRKKTPAHESAPVVESEG